MTRRKCVVCGKDPAEGYASIYTRAKGEQFFCHGDDDDSPTCYESPSSNLELPSPGELP